MSAADTSAVALLVEPAQVEVMRTEPNGVLPRGFLPVRTERSSHWYEDGLITWGVRFPRGVRVLEWQKRLGPPPPGWIEVGRSVYYGKNHISYVVREGDALAEWFWAVRAQLHQARRLLYLLGWAILRFGCWCARVRVPQWNGWRETLERAAGAL